MTLPFGNGIRDAIRLTKDGKLTEAVERIQATLAGRLAPEPASEANASDALEMVPPKMAGGAWTAPDAKGRPEFQRPLWKHTPDARPTARPDGKTGGTFTFLSFSNDAGSRRYKLYVPANPGVGARPLIIMLHGCTQSPDDFAAGTRMNALAEEFGFFVAYPEQTSGANASKCWNWFNTIDQQRDQGEPSLLAGIARQIIASQNIDPKRVFVAGLSAGGAAAAIMGQTYPDLFAAVGIHSGLACGAAKDMMSAFTVMKQGPARPLPASTAPGRAVRAIVFHGDKDGTVGAVNGEHAARQFSGSVVKSETSDGTAGGTKFKRIRHIDRHGQTIVENWTVHGGAHTWFGGSASGSFTSPKGPDASREMVRFFLES